MSSPLPGSSSSQAVASAASADLSTSSSSSSPPPVVSTLQTKPSWTSEELAHLLDQEANKRALLQSKKDEAESEAERLTTEGKGDIQTELDYLNKLFLKVKALITKMTKDKLPNRREHGEFYEGVEKADELEKASAYLTVLQFYTATSEQIDVNMESGLEMEAIELFHRLKLVEVSYLDVAECGHLNVLGKGIVSFWEDRLTKKLATDFEQLLEAFGWPMRLKTATPTLETHEKFHRTVINLSKISSTVREGICSDQWAEQQQENLNDSFVPILPIQILMVQLKRRFRYHFLSDKATSESTRPEWYFSQVKLWIYELVPFVKTWVEQATVSEIGISSLIEFIRCMSEMLILKVDAHLNDDPRDGVFVKILEESITFENEIGDFLAENLESVAVSYLPAFVNCIFSRPPILERWIRAEQSACLEKLDEMFSSQSAWNKPVAPGPPEIVDLFIAVIRSLTDRFAHLYELSQKLQFLHLLNDLLEEFHVRCLQTWKSKLELSENVSKDVLIDYIIADALYSVHDILQEWEYLPFFASLSCATQDLDNDGIGTTTKEFSMNQQMQQQNDEELQKGSGVFTNACGLYWCLADEIQSKWCNKVAKKVKEEFLPYAKLKWQSIESTNTSTPERLSDQILRPLQTIKDLGQTLGSCMDPKNAEKWMKKLAVKLDEALMENIIFPNQFSRAGVLQLNLDFNTGIFPVFTDNGVNEKLFFGSIVSALTILRISTGEAMLLYDTLMNGNFEAHEVALAELEISICQSKVIKLLRNRCDLRI